MSTGKTPLVPPEGHADGLAHHCLDGQCGPRPADPLPRHHIVTLSTRF